jgi:hypothetical protein
VTLNIHLAFQLRAALHLSFVLKSLLQGKIVSILLEHTVQYLPEGCGDCSPLLENDNEVKECEREDSHDFSS